MSSRTPVDETYFQIAAALLEGWINTLDEMPRDLSNPSDWTLGDLAAMGDWAATDNLTEEESSAIRTVYWAAVNWRAGMGRPPVRFAKHVDAAAIAVLEKLRNDVLRALNWSGLREFGELIVSATPPDEQEASEIEEQTKLCAALESCIEVKRSRKQGKCRARLSPRSSLGSDPELREYLGPDWLAYVDRLVRAETFEQTVCCVRIGKAEFDLRKALNGDLDRLRAELNLELAAVAAGVQRPTAGQAPGSALPDWVGEYFQRNQYKLLRFLWGRTEVPIVEVKKEIYSSGIGKDAALDKVKDRVNKKLAQINQPFEILTRRREVLILQRDQ
jgi:hypothetical protein